MGTKMTEKDFAKYDYPKSDKKHSVIDVYEIFSRQYQNDLKSHKDENEKTYVKKSDIDNLINQAIKDHFKQRSENQIERINEKKRQTSIMNHEHDNASEEWIENKVFFEKNEAKFKTEYPNKYVAVHKGKVIGVGEDIGAVVTDAYHKYGNIPLYCDKPGDEEIIKLDLPIVC